MITRGGFLFDLSMLVLLYYNSAIVFENSSQSLYKGLEQH